MKAILPEAGELMREILLEEAELLFGLVLEKKMYGEFSRLLWYRQKDVSVSRPQLAWLLATFLAKDYPALAFSRSNDLNDESK